MSILEYENLGLFVKINNAGTFLTPYRDEAAIFHSKSGADNFRKIVDERLFGGDPYYEKGHLIVREVYYGC